MGSRKLKQSRKKKQINDIHDVGNNVKRTEFFRQEKLIPFSCKKKRSGKRQVVFFSFHLISTIVAYHTICKISNN